MIRTFKPRLDVLPPAQKRLWPELVNAPNLGFTLYGDTAIALRLGHRHSVDFDFFSEKPLDREAIKMAFPLMAESTTLQDQGSTWVVLARVRGTEQEHVKVSFFEGIVFGRVGEPDFTDDGVLQVAALDDLMATKVKVVLQRAEAKDYRDVAAMIDAGADMARALASARLLFGPNFQPSESLKALVYFADGDLNTLTVDDKRILIDAVKSVRDLPDVAPRSRSLSGLAWRDLRVMDEQIGGLAKLEKRCGVAFIFWRRATQALKKHGAGDVNWPDVERATIVESISPGESPAPDLADVICQYSPGAVTMARQDEVRAMVEELAQGLSARDARTRGGKRSVQ